MLGDKEKQGMERWIKSGITGFDKLFEKGIPKGVNTLVAGGPGSGKTIFCLQTLNYGASRGEKCLYMSFEESSQRLRDHMHDFGWQPEKLEEKGQLLIRRYDPLEIGRSVEALMEKEEKELLIESKPVVIPDGFVPDRVVLDSLSAIAAHYVNKTDTYRVYVEQLFRYFEDLGANTFLITESPQTPEGLTEITKTGVEEFLADGVIVLYNIRMGDSRGGAIEVLKMRGAKFQKKLAPMEIVTGEGLVVYPDQKVFGV